MAEPVSQEPSTPQRGAVLRLSPGLARWSIIANPANLFLNQGPPAAIGPFLPAPFVGFFALPFPLSRQVIKAVSRAGLLTRPRTRRAGHAPGARQV